MEKTFEAAVVGAGPAGAVTAFCLAKAGVKTLLIEKERLPRYKTCGGGLVGRVFKFSPPEINISPAVDRSFRAAELNFLDAGLHFPVERGSPLIAMTMRETLDLHLARAAAGAGAAVLEQTQVKGFSETPGEITLETGRGPFHVKILVAADGALSPVAKLAGWAETRRLIPALEYEAQVPARIFSRFAARPRFDFGVVPAGYGWVFPKASHLSIGVLTTRRGGVNLESFYRAYLHRLGVDEVTGEARHGFQIPVSPRTDGFSRGRVFLAGDAAGFADPITAEGISHAILSGRLAAEALISSRLDPGKAAVRYQEALQSEILPELKLARFLARVVYDFPRVRNFAFRKMGRRFAEAVTDIVMGEKNYRACFRDRRALFTLLWRLLAGPPAAGSR